MAHHFHPRVLLAGIAFMACFASDAQAADRCSTLHAKCVIHVGGSCDPKTGLKYPTSVGITGEAAYYQCVTDHNKKTNPVWKEQLRKSAIGTCITSRVPYYSLNDKQAQLRMPNGGLCHVGYVSGTTATIVERPRHATLTLSPRGGIRFDPSPHYRGSDRFVLRLCTVARPDRCYRLTYNVTVD
jgi:hypothetical protein